MGWNPGCQCTYIPHQGNALEDWQWHHHGCDVWKDGRIQELEAQLAGLREAVIRHNSECAWICDHRENCHPTHHCPDCPKDYRIDLPDTKEEG